MGYQSFNDISILQFRGEKQKAVEDFKALLESVEEDGFEYAADKDGDESIASFEDNHSTMIKDIIEESKNYPGLMLEVNFDATNEDSDDQRRIRILEGKSETVFAVIEFPPFCEILTDEEKGDSLQMLSSVELRGRVGTVEKTETGTLVSVSTSIARTDEDGKPTVETTWQKVNIPEAVLPDKDTIRNGCLIHVTGRLYNEIISRPGGIEYSSLAIMATEAKVIDGGNTPATAEDAEQPEA